MVLKEDVPGLELAEAFAFGELAVRHRLVEFLGETVVLENLHAVQIMLDVSALYLDHGQVPAVALESGLALVGGEDVIESARKPVVFQELYLVAEILVVDYLVFTTYAGVIVGARVDEIFDSTVGEWIEYEFGREDEIAVDLLGYDVSTSDSFRIRGYYTILNGPSDFREIISFYTLPPFKRVILEKGSPAGTAGQQDPGQNDDRNE